MATRYNFTSGFVLSAALLAPAFGHPTTGTSETCTCDAARLQNGWCGKCQVGYVGGLRIPSALLYEEIDPHGHDIDKDRVSCPSCKTAIATDGFCHKCNIGYVDGKAYMSKLTYCLAQGTAVKPEALTCETCTTNAKTFGWCNKCKRGMIGPVAFTDRKTYGEARNGYDIIQAALQKLDKCRICAAAIVANGYCFKCKMQYRDGEPVHAGESVPQPPRTSEHDHPATEVDGR